METTPELKGDWTLVNSKLAVTDGEQTLSKFMLMLQRFGLSQQDKYSFYVWLIGTLWSLMILFKHTCAVQVYIELHTVFI